MPLIWETVFTSELGSTCARPYRCERCGHEDTAYATATALGQGAALFGIDKHGAIDEARQNAEKALEKEVSIVESLAGCPSCDASAARDRAKKITLAIGVVTALIPMLVAVAIAVSRSSRGLPVAAREVIGGGFCFSVPFIAVGIYLLIDRGIKWKRRTKPGSVVWKSRLDEAAVAHAVSEIQDGAFVEPFADRMGVPAGVLSLLAQRSEAESKASAAELKKLRKQNKKLEAENRRLRGEA